MELDQAIRFLQNFGYLPQSDLETQALRSMDEISRALLTAQKFGAIKQTGQLDRATQQLMRRGRCGVPDIIDNVTDDVTNKLTNERRRRRRFVLQGNKWDKRILTYSITGYSEDIPRGTTRQIIHEAFKVWSDASSLTFFETATTDEKNPADILIEFARYFHGDPFPFDGPSRVLAHAFFPGPDRGGDIHFDDDELWTLDDRRGVILKEVAIHEIGHSLGLAHSFDPTSAMFPYYTNVGKDFRLPYDDAHGIHVLYGPRHHHKSPPIQEVTVAPRGFRTQGWTGPSNTGLTLQPTTLLPKVTTQTRHSTVKVDKTQSGHHDTNNDKGGGQNSDSIGGTGGEPFWCGSNYQVIAMIRKEIFMFNGKWFWRVKDGTYQKSNMELISRFWLGFPPEQTSIDAIYERPIDGNILLFKDQKVWMFHTNKLLPGYPKMLQDLGLPPELKKIDTALVWGYNKKTYFFASNMYWRFDESLNKVAPDYPRYIGVWRGIPTHLNSALVDKDGITHFFKGPLVYKFVDRYMSVNREYPQPFYTFFVKQHSKRMLHKNSCKSSDLKPRHQHLKAQKQNMLVPKAQGTSNGASLKSLFTLYYFYILIVYLYANK